MSRSLTRFALLLVTLLGFSVLTQEASAQFSLNQFGAGFNVSPQARLNPLDNNRVMYIRPGYRVLTPTLGMRYGMGGLGARNSIGVGKMGKKRIDPHYRRQWRL